MASKQHYVFVSRKRGTCFSLNYRWNPGWAEPSQVETCGQRTAFPFGHKKYEQPEQPREARWGRGKHTADGSSLPQKKCFECKNENRANPSFFPPPICILKDYKPKEKVARRVPLTSTRPSPRFSDQVATLVFSLCSTSLLSLSCSSIPPTFLFFYWSIVDLQCCVNFCCTAKWFSHMYMYIYIYIYTFFFIFFSIMVHHRTRNAIQCAI